jgi:hypothetical protein
MNLVFDFSFVCSLMPSICTKTFSGLTLSFERALELFVEILYATLRCDLSRNDVSKHG